jgi:hypothetical protein
MFRAHTESYVHSVVDKTNVQAFNTDSTAFPYVCHCLCGRNVLFYIGDVHVDNPKQNQEVVETEWLN